MANQQDGSPNAREAQYWNSAATQGWANRHEPIDRLFAGLTQVALDLANPRPGESVIDIGCGSGTTVLQLAARVGGGGHVMGVDISRQSTARARQRIDAAGLRQAEVVLADVSTHEFAPNSFDLAFSRFGVMFFADPSATFAHLRNAMKPDGRLAFAVFRTAEENRWASAPAAAIRHLLPPVASPLPEATGQFSWADPERVHRILKTAGFRDISLTPHDPAMQLAEPGGAAEAADFAMSFGAAARATLDGPVDLREAVRSALQNFFQSLDGPRGIVLPGAIWAVRARV